MLLLFETHSPTTQSAVEEVFAAVRLAHARDYGATVVLIQEGVMQALQAEPMIQGLLDAGVPVLADRFSLAIRGIPAHRLLTPIQPVDMAAIVELLTRNGTRPLWH